MMPHSERLNYKAPLLCEEEEEEEEDLEDLVDDGDDATSGMENFIDEFFDEPVEQVEIAPNEPLPKDELSASTEGDPLPTNTDDEPLDGKPAESPSGDETLEGQAEPNAEELDTPPAEEIASTDTSAPEQLSAEQVQQGLDNMRSELEKTYNLSDEDADVFATDPQAVIPKLMANMHMQITQQLLQIVSQALPQQISATTARVQNSEKLSNDFGTMFPDLKGTDPKVMQTAVGLVKQQMPADATMEEKMQRTGQLIYAMTGKAAPAPQAKGTPPARRSKPHTPAKGSQSAPPTPQPKGKMEALFSEFNDV